MSTLRVDSLLNAAGNESPISIPGTAKAWVNFNGTGTPAIRDSFNVSSITDNGTGDFTVNFATNMPSTSYVPLVTTIARSNASAGTTPPGIRSANSTGLPNASIGLTGVRFVHRPTSTNVDSNMYGLVVFGD